MNQVFEHHGAGATGPISIQSVFTGDGSSQPKTSFKPGDTITLNIVVSNATGQTISAVPYCADVENFERKAPGRKPRDTKDVVGKSARMKAKKSS